MKHVLLLKEVGYGNFLLHTIYLKVQPSPQWLLADGYIYIPMGSKHACHAAGLKQARQTAQLNTASSQLPVRCMLENSQAGP